MYIEIFYIFVYKCVFDAEVLIVDTVHCKIRRMQLLTYATCSTAQGSHCEPLFLRKVFTIRILF